MLDGYRDGTFRPNGTATRAELFKIIDTTFGYKGSIDNPFSDLTDANWYYDNAIHLAAAGILDGENGKVNGDLVITREEAFALLARVLDVESDESGIDKFVDKADISDWAKGELGGLAKAGYIQGKKNNKLLPQDNITRAEIVTVLDNAIAM